MTTGGRAECGRWRAGGPRMVPGGLMNRLPSTAILAGKVGIKIGGAGSSMKETVKKKKSRSFLLDHPMCCFCGGSEPATTEDHIPARAFFYGRRWPEGYSFPACEACNRDSKVSEAIAAVISRCFPDPLDAKETDELRRQVEGIRNDDPRRRQKARADALHDADTCYVSRTAYLQFRPCDPHWVPTAV